MKKSIAICIVTALAAALCGAGCSAPDKSAGHDVPTAAIPEVGEVYTSAMHDDLTVNAYYKNSGIINAPTVVCDVTDGSVLSAALGDVRPSNVVLHVDGDGNVRGGESVIGSFSEVYGRIRGKTIPIVDVESAAAADKFISYMTEECDILDISVMSSDAALVRRVRSALPRTRGIWRVTGNVTPSAAVSTANENLAAVILLPQSRATRDTVTYIQARLKTVWAEPDSYLFADICDCITSGAYGIVSPYFIDVYDVLDTFTQTTLARTPMNVAHRGCSNLSYENSLSAIRLALERGATHLELDGYITSDDQIVIIHDPTLNGTTNGTGNVESMTLETVQSYEMRTRNGEYLTDGAGNNIIEHIPSLRDVLDLMKNTDAILVFEIKSAKTKIVSVFKAVLEEYGMTDRAVVITFDDNILDEMNRVLPQMPAARLEGLGGSPWTVDELATVLAKLGEKNAALDKSYSHGGASLMFNRYLRDRGMVGWYWTFADEAAVRTAYELGYLGVTNNCAEIFRNKIRYADGKGGTVSDIAVGGSVAVTLTTYGGEVRDGSAEVVYCRQTSGGYRVIARVETDEGYIYTPSFFVETST